MKSRYSPRQKTLSAKGKKVKRNPKESLSQYWDRVNKLRGVQ